MGARPQPAEALLPRRLRREWHGALVICAVVTILAALLLSRKWLADDVLRWCAGTALALAYLLWELGRSLPHNRRAGNSAVLNSLGLGTSLTLLRGLLTGLLAGFLLVPTPSGVLAWAPAFLYLGVGLADFFDGYLARRHDHATQLGAILDIRYDAFGTLIALGVLIHHGQLPAHFLLVGLAYYAFHGHMRLRQKVGLPTFALPANPYRRLYAGMFFGYLPVVLAPAFSPPWTVAAGYLFAAPVAGGFVIDWLVATGRVSTASASWQRWEHFARRFLYRRAPVVLRAAALASGGVVLSAGLQSPASWADLLRQGGWPLPFVLATLFAAAWIAALGMTASAWLGRVAALGLITLVCFDILLRGFEPIPQYLLLSTAIGILLLGTGNRSLWNPEDALLLRHHGKPRAPARAAHA